MFTMLSSRHTSFRSPVTRFIWAVAGYATGGHHTSATMGKSGNATACEECSKWGSQRTWAGNAREWAAIMSTLHHRHFITIHSARTPTAANVKCCPLWPAETDSNAGKKAMEETKWKVGVSECRWENLWKRTRRYGMQEAWIPIYYMKASMPEARSP